MKVFELARELELKPLDLVETLKDEGFSVRNHMSALSDDELIKVRGILEAKEEAAKPVAKKKTKRKTTKKKKVTAAKKATKKKTTKKKTTKKVTKKTVVKKVVKKAAAAPVEKEPAPEPQNTSEETSLTSLTSPSQTRTTPS